MSDLYSGLPSTGDGPGSGVDSTAWVRPQPRPSSIRRKPPTTTQKKFIPQKFVSATPTPNKASSTASTTTTASTAHQSTTVKQPPPTLTNAAQVKELNALQQRIAAASAKLANNSKAVLRATMLTPKEPPVVVPATNVQSEKDMFPVYSDQYDPSKPNDYVRYCERRLVQKKKERAQRDLERQIRKLAEERQRVKEEEARTGFGRLRAAVETARSGGRGLGRGQTIPAWMKEKGVDEFVAAAARKSKAKAPPPPAFNASKAEPGEFDDPKSSRGSTKRKAMAPPPPSFGGKSLDKAARMMSKMGYQAGRGLGAREDGIKSALVHKPTGRGMGKVVAPPPPSFASKTARRKAPAPPSFNAGSTKSNQAAMPPPQRKMKVGVKNPSKIVLLRNMVNPGEVFIVGHLCVGFLVECESSFAFLLL